jgi:integrase
MARPATGSVVERQTQKGTVYALRFRAYGQREYLTLGTREDGWNKQSAQKELTHVLADVDRGIWTPPQPAPAPTPPTTVPTFREYADQWLEAREADGLRESTIEAFGYAFRHLFDSFGDKPLDQITISDVDSFKTLKVRERESASKKHTLSNVTINKHLSRMAQVLEYAIEDGWIERNPAKGKRRRLKAAAPKRAWLQTSDQMAELLEAAGELGRRTSGLRDRAMLASMMFAGLRIGEAMDLRRKDLDLPTGRIIVRASKTAAGEREVNIVPALRDELLAYLATVELGAEDYVFGTATGGRENESNVRNRVVRPSVEAANASLTGKGLAPMSDKVTPHSLRHTFASVLVNLGEDPVYVMAQLGHTDPAFTLKIYSHVMQARGEEKGRIKALINGVDWAPTGTKASDGQIGTSPALATELLDTAPRAA